MKGKNHVTRSITVNGRICRGDESESYVWRSKMCNGYCTPY